MNIDNSKSFFAKAQAVIPGGVNSPVRACKSVGCDPLFVKKALGAKITDVDNNEFIDFVNGLLCVSLGYADADVDLAVREQQSEGVSFSLPP